MLYIITFHFNDLIVVFYSSWLRLMTRQTKLIVVILTWQNISESDEQFCLIKQIAFKSKLQKVENKKLHSSQSNPAMPALIINNLYTYIKPKVPNEILCNVLD